MDGLRTIALKLDFGVSHNQTFNKYHFFHLLLDFISFRNLVVNQP